jgi:hypothetical protein
MCAALPALAACSGDAPEQVPQGQGGEPSKGGESARRGPATAPEPRDSLEDGARRFTAAVNSNECEEVREVAFAGPQLSEEACDQLQRQLAGFEAGESAEYGTAGVVDYSADQGVGSVGFVVGRDGRFAWGLRLGRQPNEAVAGTEPPDGNRLDEVAQSATDSLRDGSCEELARAARGILPEPNQPKTQCENSRNLTERLKQDPDARPELLGANSRAAFYSLLPKPNGPYLTLVLLQEGRRAAFQRLFSIPAERSGRAPANP